MIEADQATEPPPSANEKDAAAAQAPANPANTIPLEGQYWNPSYIFECSVKYHKLKQRMSMTSSRSQGSWLHMSSQWQTKPKGFNIRMM